MENLRDVETFLREHNYCNPRRMAVRWAPRQCSCCRDQHTASIASRPQKRKRTSEDHPSQSAEPPVVTNMVTGPQPSAAPLQYDVQIHTHSVEEYQQIYHEVVDDMLRYQNGRVRPYSLALGRRIKQRLWERVNRPMMMTSAQKDGLLHVDVSYGVGIDPPHYAVDIVEEPKPKRPPRKS